MLLGMACPIVESDGLRIASDMPSV